MFKLASPQVTALVLLAAGLTASGLLDEPTEYASDYTYHHQAPDGSLQASYHWLMPYDPRVREPLEEKVRRTVALQIEEIFGPIENMIVKSIGVNSAKAFFQLTKAGNSLIGITRKQKAENKKLGIRTTVDKEYMQEFREYLTNAVKESHKIAATMKKDNSPAAVEELREQTAIFLHSLKHALMESKVGGFVDWKKTTLNGELFSEIAPVMMAKMQNNGLGLAFNLFDLLL